MVIADPEERIPQEDGASIEATSDLVDPYITKNRPVSAFFPKVNY